MRWQARERRRCDALEIDPGLAGGHASEGGDYCPLRLEPAGGGANSGPPLICGRDIGGAPVVWRVPGRHGAFGGGDRGGEIRAVADPLSPLINSVLAAMYCFSRQYDMAERSRRRLKLESNFWVARLFSGMALVQSGKSSSGRLTPCGMPPTCRRVRRCSLPPWVTPMRLAGREEDAACFTKLVELSKKQYIPPLHLALVALGLHEDEVALGNWKRG